ncbi:MAG: histidine phosphatase family protein [Betaproteobacteria bacterium]|nr:histidine phosphatase family protein [Betaproteobacteria bacterium]
MDLILWRHADAEEGFPDLARKLTSKGQRQADNVAAWLQQRLPAKFSVLASPAARAQQTASALGVPFKTVDELAPGASVAEILRAADWPERKGPVVVVGHQPDLGRAAAHLIGADAEFSIKKGGLWWLSNRMRDGEPGVVVRAVLAPDLL